MDIFKVYMRDDDEYINIMLLKHYDYSLRIKEIDGCSCFGNSYKTTVYPGTLHYITQHIVDDHIKLLILAYNYVILSKLDIREYKISGINFDEFHRCIMLIPNFKEKYFKYLSTFGNKHDNFKVYKFLLENKDYLELNK
jgi:hypothetical protein